MRSTPREIEYVLFPGALGLDITGPLEVFSTASLIVEREERRQGYRSVFSALEKGSVRLSSGLELLANHSFSELSHADTILIPGGSSEKETTQNPRFMNYIRKRCATAQHIISVCKGAIILAAAGVLEGKQATTHWRALDEFAEKFPGVHVAHDAVFVHDGNISTSAGVTAGIDLALALVEEDYGPAVAAETARLLVIYYRRPGSHAQISSALQAQESAGKRFGSLHKWLKENLEKPIRVEDMAHRVAMSPRNFVRVFKEETGITPSDFLETLRLNAARELLTTGDCSLQQIAELSGFGREERLRRAFLRRFDMTPSQFRG